MINDDGYNYPDVSFPAYDDGGMRMEITDDNSSQCSPSKINENNTKENKEEAYQKSSCVDHKGSTLLQENLNIALINVLEMAKEYSTNNLVDSDKIIGDESIRRVQEFLGQIKNNFKSPEETNL